MSSAYELQLIVFLVACLDAVGYLCACATLCFTACSTRALFWFRGVLELLCVFYRIELKILVAYDGPCFAGFKLVQFGCIVLPKATCLSTQ